MKKIRPGQKIKLTSVEELLGVSNEESAMDIEVVKIQPFRNHPFKVIDDEKMEDLVESIRTNGILSPVLIRPIGNDIYEMVSGHRRMHAAILLGMDRIPAIIREMTDDEAIVKMVDANIQREELLPSEKAFAYKMKMDAMKNQGYRSDLTADSKTSCQFGTKSRADQQVSGQVGESARQVQRFIRLTELIPELLEYVDQKRLQFTVAVEISYIDKEVQKWLYEYIKDNGMVFRLRNEYPDWQISELGRNIYCKGPAAFCALGNAVLMAGSTSLQEIQTTQDYGDMRPQEMGGQVRNEIKTLSPDVKVRFLPAIHQVWFIDDSQYVLVFDASTGVFTERYFNSEVVDALCVDSKVFIAKRERLCLLNESDEFKDDGKALVARAHFKTDAALRDQLIKSVALSITPLTSFYNDVKGCALHVSRVTLPFPKRRATKDGQRMQKTGLSVAVKEPQSTPGYDGDDEVFLNYEAVTPGRSVLYKKRQICRDEAIRVSLEATGFPFYLNFISYDKVEV